MLFIHFKTLFSFRFYQRLVLLSWRQTTGFVLYLFFLSILVFFFFTGSMLRRDLPVFLKNFPQVTFEKGYLTAPDKPVFAPIPQTDFKIVFDASATTPPAVQELVDSRTLAWVHKNQIYIPSASGLQQRTLPENVNFTATPDTLEKYKNSLAASIRLTILFLSFFFVAFLLVTNFVLALGVILFFNFIHKTRLPRILLTKLALFVLGPLVTLWLVRLWVSIPLFGLAQVLLCIIYVQQIFNVLTENPYEN